MQYPPMSMNSNGAMGAAGPHFGYGYDAIYRPQTMSNLATSQSMISATTYGVAGQLSQITGSAYNETRTYNSLFSDAR
jgi:hypothetical protein